MDAFACSDLLDSMQAYYKVALKTFVDNLSIQIVEGLLIGDIWSIFSPSDVGKMAPSLISKIAAESPESQALRQQLDRKLQTLKKGMEICQRHSTHPTSASPAPTPFTSLLSIPISEALSPSLPPTTAAADPTTLFHVEYGLAKDFGLAGLHVGALITHNADVCAAFDAIGLLHAPSGASCAIASRLLSDTAFVDSILALSRTRLAENHLAVTRALDEAGIGYWKGGNAGYFLWVDLSAHLAKGKGDGGDGVRKQREEALAGRILKGGVWLNPGQERGEKPRWFRLIFSHDKTKVMEGVRRIIKTLQGGTTTNVTIRQRKEESTYRMYAQ